MLPLLVAGGAFVAALILSGCEDSPPPPEEPVHVPFPTNEETTENVVDAGPSPNDDGGVVWKSFLEDLPHAPEETNLVPLNPCGIKFHEKGMSRFAASIWGERSLKFEEVVKIADLIPPHQGQDRILIYRGDCSTPIRQLLRITQEEFRNEKSGIRLATLSLLACFQNAPCSEQKKQFAYPATESLRELFLIDENKDGTEDLLLTTDGKYSYVFYGEKLSPGPK